MYSIMFEKLVFFLIFLNLNSLVASDDLKEKIIDGGTRGPSMWFGPRLGKRSTQLSTDNGRDSLYRMLEAADILKYYYNQLPYNDMSADDPEPTVTKKVIFTPKMGRRAESSSYSEKRGYDLDFTPRLGRRLADDFGVTPPDQEIYQSDQMDGKARYFSPRLGRSRNFSPRLGRNLMYESFPDKVRVARSINKTMST